MKNIVVFNMSGTGHVNPTLPIIEQLVRLGYRVRYYSVEAVRAKVESTGATFIPYGDAKWSTAQYGPAGAKFDNMFYAQAIVNQTVALLPRFLDELNKDLPDLIINDALAIWGKAVAIILGIKSVASIPSFVVTKEFHHKLLNGRNQFEDELIVKGFEQLYNTYPALKGKFTPYDLFNARGEKNIVYTSEKLQHKYEECFGSKFSYVGPVFGKRVDDPDFEFEKVRDARRPVVLVCMGTVFPMGIDFYKNFIDGLGNQELTVILGVGKAFDFSTLPPNIPSNIIIKDYLPQLALLQHHASIFVTHCGFNSLNESLYYGVPMICIPLFAEQPINAERLEELGLGVALEKSALTSDIVNSTVWKILKDSSYSQKAREYSAEFKKCGGVNQAIATIEELLSQK